MAENKEEDVKLGANKYTEKQPLGTSAQTTDKDYKEPPPAPFFEPGELSSWSFYRAGIAEFMATLLFLYITVLTVMGVNRADNKCASVGIQGIAWAFGGMIFALVYCTAGISGGHINPAVTFGLFLARKLSLTRAVFYMVMQCLGAVCGAGIVKGFMKGPYQAHGGGANVVNQWFYTLYGSGPLCGGLLALLSLSTLSSLLLMPREMLETHMFLFWLLSPSDLQCSWFTWPPSLLLEPASTQPVVLELPSSTTRITPGTTTGSSGLAPSSELHLPQCTT
ncbi:hypothetical protein Leryth_016172 [Lithospermum erythrorhizon]|nr:hypothetical protein Leryth_016172 [Lithospermum erythrorhizon]